MRRGAEVSFRLFLVGNCWYHWKDKSCSAMILEVVLKRRKEKAEEEEDEEEE